jgi:N-acetyl-1-D-myo-inositol-2-amino-2-deoxy-alpha-D-glucopyranoside deacetylase
MTRRGAGTALDSSLIQRGCHIKLALANLTHISWKIKSVELCPSGRPRPTGSRRNGWRLVSDQLDADGNPLRLLLVHAHPDDETTTTGATIARYRSQGLPVTLVTCTRGERGEDVTLGVPIYTDDEKADQLGRQRVAELDGATRALGLADARFLGGAGAWWDSGMADAPVPHPRAFSAGDLDEQTAQLVAIVREVRPQVIVTYDERGGYGHPDHIRAHDVAVAAFEAAADPAAFPAAGPVWQVSKLYAAVIPFSRMRRAAKILAAAPPNGGSPLQALADAPEDTPAEAVPFAVPDELVCAQIDAREWIGAKAAAMRSHRTQMAPDSWFFALADEPGADFAREYYRILRGRPAPERDGELEDDLFAGLR